MNVGVLHSQITHEAVKHSDFLEPLIARVDRSRVYSILVADLPVGDLYDPVMSMSTVVVLRVDLLAAAFKALKHV